MTASAIEWTDKVWNPVAGCARVSDGCRNCYAEVMAARHVLMSRAQGRESPYLPVVDAEKRRWNRKFITLPERLADPLGWRKPARVFVNSMSDLFGEGVPFEFIAAVFGVMAATPRHTYQVLTKRPARMLEFLGWLNKIPFDKVAAGLVGDHRPWLCVRQAGQAAGQIHVQAESLGDWPLPNVWLGVSVEDQAAANERIPLLLRATAAIRFLSCEPLLGPVDLSPDTCDLCGGNDVAPADDGAPWCVECDHEMGAPGWLDPEGIDWVIVGGESGPGARTCKVSWVRDIVRQCSEAGVPVFVKQLGARPDFVEPLAGGGQSIESMLRHGEYEEEPVVLRDRKGGDPAEWPEDLRVRQWPEATAIGEAENVGDADERRAGSG